MSYAAVAPPVRRVIEVPLAVRRDQTAELDAVNLLGVEAVGAEAAPHRASSNGRCNCTPLSLMCSAEAAE
jgi:hypothetical protein